jgi:glycine betaine/proline transport system substrate-binding protein
VVANLTKILLEEDLGYGNVEIQQVDLGLVFEGVRTGDLNAFQDVWLPNHAQLLSEVEGDVVQLSPCYQGQTEFGIAVPSYMTDVTTIGDLNRSNVDQIYGIEPGSVIMERIPEELEPAYNLQPKLVESSTAGMLSEVDRLYNEEEEFAFIAWRSHWMNRVVRLQVPGGFPRRLGRTERLGDGVVDSQRGPPERRPYGSGVHERADAHRGSGQRDRRGDQQHG